VKPLINFPGGGWDPSGGYEDTGEGGLYVMMVVPELEDFQDECMVDVAIQLTRPDAPVSFTGEIFVPYEHCRSGFDKSMRAHKMLKEAGEDQLASWALNTTSPDDVSSPMRVAIHLGSTSASLYSEYRASYWSATSQDLTQEGLALYATLFAAFGVEPTLLTFLDT
jgi:hypothetical protein